MTFSPNASPTVAGIHLARGLRCAAYGALTVTFGLTLAARGYGAAAVGAIISLTLIGGAVGSALSGRIVRAAGVRTTLLIAAATMVCAPLALLSHAPVMLVLAIACGSLSPSGAEVGPFAALEQSEIAHTSNADTRLNRFATYNLTGAFALSVGALAGGFLPGTLVLVGYAGCGALLALIYARLPLTPQAPAQPATQAEPPSSRIIGTLAALFALDAFGGGFVVQGFIAYWLHMRYAASAESIGMVLFAANVLAALSLLVADRVVRRVGLVRTMVFTHLPSNLLLCVVAFAPNFTTAAAILLVRFALSQIDVPVRQELTMTLVPPSGRANAAGLTNAVRPAAAAIAPVLSGAAMQFAGFGLPFIVAGTIKAAYDMILYVRFRDVEGAQTP